MKSEEQLRQELLRFGRLCYQRRLLVALDGNLSVRLPSGNLLCTRAGCHKGLLRDEDILVIDPQGKVRRGEGRPTSEVFMHLACYDQRPDVGAVIHAHPPLCVAFTLAGVGLDEAILPEVVLTLGDIPTAPYETTGTSALAESIRQYIKENDAVLMDTHGAITVGCDLLQAFCRLETMEHSAQIVKNARDLGGARTLPPEEAENLRRMGLQRYGGPPAVREKLLEEVPSEAPGAPFRLLRVTQAPLASLGDIQEQLRQERQDQPPELGPELSDLVVEEVLKALQER